jgi:hypothetical protein
MLCRVNGTNTKAQKKDYNNWVKLTIHFTTNLDVDVTEEFLEHLSAPFGAIGDTIIRSHHRQQVPTFSIHGYGVVFYYDATAALRAMEALQSKVVNGIHLRTSLSPKITGEYIRNSTSAHIAASAAAAPGSVGLPTVGMGGNGTIQLGGLNQAARSLNSPSMGRTMGGNGLGLSINTGLSSGFNGLGDSMGGDFSSSYRDSRDIFSGDATMTGSLTGIAGGGSQTTTPRTGLSSLLPPNHPVLSLSISTTNNSSNNGNGLLSDNPSVLLTSAAPSDRSVISNIYDPYQSNPSSRTTTPRNATFTYQEANARLAAAAGLGTPGGSNTIGLGSSVGFGSGFGSQNPSNSGTPVARFGAEPFSGGSSLVSGLSSSPSIPLSINTTVGGGLSLSQPSLQTSEFSLTDDRADLLYSQQARLSPAAPPQMSLQHLSGKQPGTPGSSNILGRIPGLFDNASGLGGDSFDMSISSSTGMHQQQSSPSYPGQPQPSEMEQYFMYLNRQRTVHHTALHHHLSNASPSSSRGSSPRNLNLLHAHNGQQHFQAPQQSQHQQLQQQSLHHYQNNGNGLGLPPLAPSSSQSPAAPSFTYPPVPPTSTNGSSTGSSAASSPHSHAAYLRQQQQQAWLQQQMQHLQLHGTSHNGHFNNSNSSSSNNNQNHASLSNNNHHHAIPSPPTSSPSLNRTIAPPSLTAFSGSHL